MNILQTHTGPISVNTYVLYGDNKATVIDPGGNEKRLIQMVDETGCRLEYILLTHGHFDHIGAVEALRKHYCCTVLISTGDCEMLTDDKKNLAEAFGTTVEKCASYSTFCAGDVIDFGFAKANVLATPGHTAGSCSFYIQDALFTGDTVFYDSVGRTDFPGGSYETIMSSIKNVIFSYADSTVIYPGHGQTTTVGREKRENPFLEYGWNK